MKKIIAATFVLMLTIGLVGCNSDGPGGYEQACPGGDCESSN